MRMFTMIKRRARGKGGFTLTEMLATVLILSLVSGAMAAGIRFAVDQYHRSMLTSESKVLCSTLASIIRGELSSTTKVTCDGTPDASGFRRVSKFYSLNYAVGKTHNCSLVMAEMTDAGTLKRLGDDQFGELALGVGDGEDFIGTLLISSASYSSYHLRANAAIRYNQSENIFRVRLLVAPSGKDETLIDEEFDVIPLNWIT